MALHPLHSLFLSLLCAAAPPPAPAPNPATPFNPARAAQAMALVESFQPPDPYLANKWSQAVRGAFLYAGAQKTFALQSPIISAWAAAGADKGRHADDFVHASLGDAADPAGPPPPELAAESRRFLAMLEDNDLLIHLDELAGARSRLVGPPPYWGINSPLASQETYEFGALRNLAVGAAARMAIAAEDGAGVRALLRFSAAMELGRVACGRPMLLALYTAQSIQNRVCLAAMRLVRARRFDAEQCRLLLLDLPRHRLPPPRIFLEMERVIGLDAIDRYFDRSADEHSPHPDLRPMSIADLGHDESVAAFNAAMDCALAHASARLLDNPSTGDPADDAVMLKLPDGRTDPDRLLAALLPVVPPMLLSEREHRCLRAGLAATILLELHRLEHGAYPGALDELAGMPDWPADPLAPPRPLGYRPGEGTYTLYSVGADGEDNSARPSPRPRDALVGQPRFAGADFIIDPAQ